MSHLSDPTAQRAVGNISREWNEMCRIAERIRENPYTEWAERQSCRFTGIYRRLLTDPPEEAKKEAREKPTP